MNKDGVDYMEDDDDEDPEMIAETERIRDQFEAGVISKVVARKKMRVVAGLSLVEAKFVVDNWEKEGRRNVVKKVRKTAKTFQEILFEVLDACRTRMGRGWIKQVVPIVWGDRGTGKSYMYRDYGDVREINYIPLHLGQFDSPGDMLGMGYTEAGKKNGMITKLAKPEWFPTGEVPTLLHLDEVNRANNLVAQLLHALILDRKVGKHHLHDNCFIACSANPPESEYGVADMDVAVMDRLLHIPMPEDKAGTDWVGWALKNDLDPRIIGMVSENPMLISSKVFPVPRQAPSRRSWHMLSILIEDNHLSEEALFIIANGLLGVNTANIFMEHLKDADKADKPISPIIILNNYDAVQMKVKIMASWRFRRADILAQTTYQLNNVLKNIKLTESQEANLENFKADLPDEIRESVKYE